MPQEKQAKTFLVEIHQQDLSNAEVLLRTIDTSDLNYIRFQEFKEEGALPILKGLMKFKKQKRAHNVKKMLEEHNLKNTSVSNATNPTEEYEKIVKQRGGVGDIFYEEGSFSAGNKNRSRVKEVVPQLEIELAIANDVPQNIIEEQTQKLSTSQKHRVSQLIRNREEQKEIMKRIISKEVEREDDPEWSNPYVIHDVIKKGSHKFGLDSYAYKLSFKEYDPDIDLSHALPLLAQTFDYLIDDVTESFDDNDKVKLTLHSDQLECPISLPYFTKKNLDAGKVLKQVENVVQSNKKFDLVGPFSLEVARVSFDKAQSTLGKRKLSDLERCQQHRDYVKKLKSDPEAAKAFRDAYSHLSVKERRKKCYEEWEKNTDPNKRTFYEHWCDVRENFKPFNTPPVILEEDTPEDTPDDTPEDISELTPKYNPRAGWIC